MSAKPPAPPAPPASAPSAATSATTSAAPATTSATSAPAPATATNILTIEDYINLYKINKSIDCITISINDKIANKSFTEETIIKYTEFICIITINIFENYIYKIYGVDIIKDTHITTVLTDYDTVNKTLKSFNKQDKYTYNVIYVFLTNAKYFNITDIIKKNLHESFIIDIKTCIIDIISLFTDIKFDTITDENKKKISNILDDFINFDYDMLDNIIENIKNNNILCKIVFNNIYKLILSINDTSIIIDDIVKSNVESELNLLINCNFKLLAKIIYNAYLKDNNIDNIKNYIKNKLNIINDINSLNQFKEIDTIPKQYTINSNYNLNYIAYSRTKQIIEYNITNEINFNKPKNYLKWLSSSCYMDIIVFSLLYKKNKFIYYSLLKKPFEKYYILSDSVNTNINILYDKLLNNLDEIYKYIHDKNQLILLNVGDSKSKNKLRNTLNDINTILISEKYYISISKKPEYADINLDEDENKLIISGSSKEYNILNFVILLFTIFQLNDLTTIKKKDNTLYHDITVNIPKNTTYISPDSFIDDNKDNVIIVKSKLLVLNNQNNKSIDDKLKYDKVYPPPYLKLEYNTELIYLQSIILHYDNGNDSGHYTCLFNNNTIWYEYNDLKVIDNYIPPNRGTLDEIIKNPKYNDRIVMLIYY